MKAKIVRLAYWTEPGVQCIDTSFSDKAFEKYEFSQEAELALEAEDRFLFQQVWEKVGLPVKECMEIAMNNEGQKQFRQILFSKIVPAVKRIGLLSERQRQRFDELGILQFENWQDPFESLKQSEEEIAREQAAE